jgi:hypothetical protein
MSHAQMMMLPRTALTLRNFLSVGREDRKVEHYGLDLGRERSEQGKKKSTSY